MSVVEVGLLVVSCLDWSSSGGGVWLRPPSSESHAERIITLPRHTNTHTPRSAREGGWDDASGEVTTAGSRRSDSPSGLWEPNHPQLLHLTDHGSTDFQAAEEEVRAAAAAAAAGVGAQDRNAYLGGVRREEAFLSSCGRIKKKGERSDFEADCLDCPAATPWAAGRMRARCASRWGKDAAADPPLQRCSCVTPATSMQMSLLLSFILHRPLLLICSANKQPIKSTSLSDASILPPLSPNPFKWLFF